jgi:hypothetical protein
LSCRIVSKRRDDAPKSRDDHTMTQRDDASKQQCNFLKRRDDAQN